MILVDHLQSTKRRQPELLVFGHEGSYNPHLIHTVSSSRLSALVAIHYWPVDLMWLDPDTVAAIVGSLGLAFILLTIAVWRTRRRYSGYGRWTIAGPLLLLSLFLASLRPNAPQWLSVVTANGVLVLASILCLEGARRCRGLEPRRGVVYASGAAAVGGVAFFLYVVPALNIRAMVMSTWLGIVLGRAAIVLLRGDPPTLGLRLTGGLFALTAATHVARAVYLLFVPGLNDLFALSSVNGAFFLAFFVEVSLFPVGFMLIADDQLVSDLKDVRKRMRRADAKVAHAREAEAVLRESDRQFRTLANAAPVMIWTIGPDKRCTYFNDVWLTFTGRSLEAELANGWTAGICAEDLPRCMETYTAAFDKQESFRIEHRLQRQDGEYRWLFDQGVPRFDADGGFAGYIVTAIDVTERKQAEELIHDLAGRLIVRQEVERQRIARELHDDIGQGIALLKVEIDLMATGIDSEQTRAQLSRLSSRVGEIASDVHDVSYELHPSRLRAIGLISALQSLCRDTSVQRNVRVTFTQGVVPPSVDADVSLCLYRIAQESLHNVVRHSHARDAHVTIACDDGFVSLQIADSGIGFDPRIVAHAGLGLHSMRERVAILNGQLTIDAAQGSGTQIMVRIPLASPAQHAGSRDNGSRGSSS
jgi:PAS domain S-box-containing protein